MNNNKKQHHSKEIGANVSLKNKVRAQKLINKKNIQDF